MHFDLISFLVGVAFSAGCFLTGVIYGWMRYVRPVRRIGTAWRVERRRRL